MDAIGAAQGHDPSGRVPHCRPRRGRLADQSPCATECELGQFGGAARTASGIDGLEIPRGGPAMSRTRSAGKTLIEMLIVISLMSVALGMATTTLGTRFRVKQQITNDLAQDQTLTRLAGQLRADAHAALAATIDNGCDLQMADGSRVRYRLSAPAITREVNRDQEVVH